MKGDINKLIGELPNNKAENQLVALLASVDESDYFPIIESILRSTDSSVRRSGLRLIKRLVKDKGNLLKILDIGLRKKDISEIKFWFDSLFPIMGAKRILHVINEYVQSEPELVIFSWYYLSLNIKANYPDCIVKLNSIKSEIDQLVCSLDNDLKKYWASF